MVEITSQEREGKFYIKMISSDGHRLSIMERDIAADIDLSTTNDVILIPKKGVQELKKFCEDTCPPQGELA